MEEKKKKSVEEVTPKKNNHTAIIAIVVLVLIVAVAFRGYYFYLQMKMSNPVYVTSNIIKELETASRKNLDKVDILNPEKATEVVINGKINEATFNFESGYDIKNNIFALLLDLNLKKENLLYLDGTVNANNASFKVAKDTNSYAVNTDFKQVFTELEKYLNNSNKIDSTKYVSYLRESFEENYKKDYFTKTNAKITVFEKELNTNKYTTNLNQERLSKILDSYLDKLFADEDFINLVIDLSKSSGNEITKADLKEMLPQLKEELKNELEDVNISYTLYISGRDVIRISFDIPDFGEAVIDTYKDDSSISIKSGDTKIGLTYNDKTNKYDVTMNGTSVANGTYKETLKKGNVSFELTFSIPLAYIDGKINAEVKNVKSIDQREYKNALDITKSENAAKLYEELESNEFINEIIDSVSSLLGSSWTSVDGIDL